MTAEITPHALVIRGDDGLTLRWPWPDVRQTQGFYMGEQVRLERGSGTPEALLVDDQAFVVAVRRVVRGFGKAVYDPGRRRRRVALTAVAGLAAIAVAVALYVWGIPAAAGLATAWVPVSWEDRLGAAVVAQLAPKDRRCHEPRGEAALQTIVDRLLARNGPQPYTFRVVVRDHPMVNAFAAPGGHVVIMRGLLERARSAEELAGVLAHELQHVLHRHATRMILQHVSSGLLVAALSGDVSGPLAYGVESARVLGSLSYSRRAETEADTDGLRMLLGAEVDPRGMIAFFELLQTEESSMPDVARYARTHPASAERVAMLRRLIGEPRPARPLLAPEEWTALRRLCAG